MKTKVKTNKNIIRVGDRVKVVTPTFFLRCGYPITIDEEADRVLEEHQAAISKFLQETVKCSSFYPEGGYSIHFVVDEHMHRKASREIARSLAYIRCKQKGFGGKQRQLHTEERPDYKDQEGTVRKIRYVKTGEYVPACGGGYNPWGECDYDPPYLAEDKTHKILSVQFHGWGWIQDIEAIHVLKLEETNG